MTRPTERRSPPGQAVRTGRLGGGTFHLSCHLFILNPMMKAKATYKVKKWEENTLRLISLHGKMTKASVQYDLSGDLQGLASVEYLMFYRYFDPDDQHKSSASYVGLIHFDGTLSGKSGTFVLEDRGTFQGGSANSLLRILEGSGTGSLEGINGNGHYLADQHGFRLELDYSLG